MLNRSLTIIDQVYTWNYLLRLVVTHDMFDYAIGLVIALNLVGREGPGYVGGGNRSL